MLSLRDISFSYPGRKKPLIDNFSMDLSSGEIVALVGPNGSGKTTLALIIAGIIRPDSGVIEYMGKDYSDGENLDFVRRDIGFLFQDPEDGILTTSVEREIAFGPENHGYPPVKIRDKIRQLANEFNLRDKLKKPVDELSGGELERTAFAAAVSFDPKILILDEPESYLDFRGKQRLFEEIRRQKEKGTAIIHITQSETAALQADRAISIKEINGPSANIQIFEAPECGDTVLEMTDLSFSFDNLPILSNINFALRKSECVAILGSSGSGKTTLARLAAGLYKPDSGGMNSCGRPAISFQFPARQLFADSVLEDVAFGPKSLGMTDPNELASKALREVGLNEEYFKKSPFELSDGEQRLVGLAGVLAIEPDFIFFDEPTAALDVNSRRRFMGIVSNLVGKGVGIGLITHDLAIASRCCRKALILGDNDTMEVSMDEIMANKRLRMTCGIGTDVDLFEGA